MELPFILLFFVGTVNAVSVFIDCQITKILTNSTDSVYPIKDELELQIFNERNDESEFNVNICLQYSRGGEICDFVRIRRGTLAFTLKTDGLHFGFGSREKFIPTPSSGAVGTAGVRISPYDVSAFIAENCCKDCPFEVLRQKTKTYLLPEKGSVDLLTHSSGSMESVAGIFLGRKCLLVFLHNGASSSFSCPKYSVEGTAILSLKRAKGGVRIRLSGEEIFIPFQTQSKEGLQVRALGESEIVSSYKYYGECEVQRVAAGTRSPDYLVQNRIDLRIFNGNKVPFSAKFFVQDKCLVHFFKDEKYDNDCFLPLKSQDTILRFQMTKDGLKLENQVESGSRFQNVHTFHGVQPNSSLYVESGDNDVNTAYCDCKDCPDTALQLIQENPLYPFPEEGSTELIIRNTNELKVTAGVYLGNRCLVRLHFNDAAQWDAECYYFPSANESVSLFFKQEDGNVKMRLPNSEKFSDSSVPISSNFLPGLSVKTWGGGVTSSYKHHPPPETEDLTPTSTSNTTKTTSKSTTKHTIPSEVTEVPQTNLPTDSTVKPMTTLFHEEEGGSRTHIWIIVGVLLLLLVMVAIGVICYIRQRRRTIPETRLETTNSVELRQNENKPPPGNRESHESINSLYGYI